MVACNASYIIWLSRYSSYYDDTTMTIRSKVPNEQYKENFDRIFRKDVENSGTSSTEVSVVPTRESDSNLLEVSRTDGGIG